MAPETLPRHTTAGGLTQAQRVRRAVRRALAGCGLDEAITYSLIESELQKLFVPDAATLELTNPISTDLASMRASLWPGLVTALAANQRRQQSRVRLFEVGRKFVIDPAGALREVAVVAGIAAGPGLPEQWGAAKSPVDFHDVKADVEALSRSTGANAEFRFEAQSHPALHPGQTARIVRDGLATGWIGRLHPSIESKLDLTYSSLVFELELETAFAARVPQFADVSRFPAVRRDLAVVVAEPVTVQELLDRIRSAAGSLLHDAVVFDVYRGAAIETGRKSVAIGLNLQDVSRTLTDEETDAVVARVVADLERECGATIRDR